MAASDPEPVTVANGVTVTDVFVNWQLNCFNTPEIYAVTDGSIALGGFKPVEGDREKKHWVGENDHGLFYGWQDGLPVSEETGRGWSNDPVEHAEYGTVEDRYRMLDHVVKRVQNDREPESALGVHYTQSPKGSTTTLTTRVEVAHRIIDRYVNGPLGSDGVSYWYWVRSHPDGYGFRRGPLSREDYEPYNDAEVVLVANGIYTWAPKRRVDVDESDRVYGGGNGD